MGLIYQNSSFQFHYPDGWKLDESRNCDGVTINLQSSYSMFVFITVYDDSQEPARLADQALHTMAEEYELDSEPIEELIAGRPAIGHDVSFFSLDLTNTCWIRALREDGRSILIFAQTSDFDLARSEMAFRAICASLKFAPAGPVR